MGKKSGNKFNYNKNRRRAWKKQKKLPTIGCAEVKEAWDSRKSVQANFSDMGLSLDPNKTLRIPSTKELLKESTLGAGSKSTGSKSVTEKQVKTNVIKDLEAVANAEQPVRMRLAEPEIRYCIYMMERYEDDYKAMARDDKNYYQDTPKQIRRKILTFKSIPEQYREYLNSKSQQTCSQSDNN